MPKIAVKVQNAPNKTRWTLAQHATTPTEHPKSLEAAAENDHGAAMQANHPQYFDLQDPPLPRYENYDGSQFASPPSFDRTNSGGWKGGTSNNNNNNGRHEDYEYNTPLEERASHQISLSTHMRSQQDRRHHHDQNGIGEHLLYETAMMDSQSFEILHLSEVDALKKEHARLASRIDAASRKLAFESKVRDAAQNLQRLYSVGSGSGGGGGGGNRRPDTPQSPSDGSPSAKKSRSSLLGGRNRSSSGAVSVGQTSNQAEAELALSVRKVEELKEVLKGLVDRRQLVESRLLRHTAAVLAEQAVRSQHQLQQRVSRKTTTNGRSVDERRVNDEDDDDDDDDDDDSVSSTYSPDDFDGIRDIIRAMPTGLSNGKSQKPGNVPKLQEEHEQQMASVQARLEQLNHQLRHVIEEASRTRGVPLEAEPQFDDEYNDDNVTNGRLDHRFVRLENNLHLLEQEQRDTKAHYAQIQDSAYMTRNAVEEQLAAMNERMHHTLLLGADMSNLESLRQPPQATGHGYQHQLQYLEESLMTMERLLEQHNRELHSAREASGGAAKAVEDAHAKASLHAGKVDEYEATLGGLWEILQSDTHTHREVNVDDDDGLPSPGTPLREDFSLQAFSARVQHVFDRAQSAKEQHEILRRQIQQQRELNGKSDAEKDRQFTELQTRHERLGVEHGAAQEELSRSMARCAEVEGEHDVVREELNRAMARCAEVEGEHDVVQEELSRAMARCAEVEGKHDVVQEELSRAMARCAEVEGEHDVVQEELSRSMARCAQAEGEASQSKLELMNIANEVEGLKRAVGEARQQERDEAARQMQTHQTHAETLAAQVENLEAQVADLTDDARIFTVEHDARTKELEGKHEAVVGQLSAATTAREAAEQRHATVQKDLEGLESEVVRLTTELTMARAELEGAYGSRAERAKEAQVQEVARLTQQNKQMVEELQALREKHELALAESQKAVPPQQPSDSGRTKELENELQALATDFQDLVKESLALEKERGQLEELIDSLRERCEGLEAKLGDERVRWLGVKSPTAGMMVNGDGGRDVGAEREMTSTMVLRQEFKKMMRETRAEGMKALRAEQEQRRQAESELRRIRQANGALTSGSGGGRVGSSSSSAAGQMNGGGSPAAATAT